MIGNKSVDIKFYYNYKNKYHIATGQ